MEAVKSMTSSISNSTPIHNKEIALSYIWCFVGKWYKWGGDNPQGFDCSGLVIEYLKSAGLLLRKYDGTAQMIYDMFATKLVSKPSRGCLVFYGENTSKIIHVEIMLNSELTIGASGGGSKTLSEADAIRDNAFIKVRRATDRSGIVGYIDPFK